MPTGASNSADEGSRIEKEMQIIEAKAGLVYSKKDKNLDLLQT